MKLKRMLLVRFAELIRENEQLIESKRKLQEQNEVLLGKERHGKIIQDETRARLQDANFEIESMKKEIVDLKEKLKKGEEDVADLLTTLSGYKSREEDE
jgi:chromosome segregation ATPase